jgi:hypothetical protein
MSRLDGNDGDVENQRDKSDAQRLSAYSNARRKSEVAREDAVNRDIDEGVRMTKEKRRQRKAARRASRSSGEAEPEASFQVPSKRPPSSPPSQSVGDANT